MLSAASSNMNFKGNVTIGDQTNDKWSKINAAKDINTISHISSDCSGFVIHELNKFAKELAPSTGHDKNFSIGFSYDMKQMQDHFVKDDLMSVYVRDHDTEEPIIVKRKFFSKYGRYPETYKLNRTISDLFSEAKEEIFKQLNLDEDKIEENERINKIFDRLA